MKTLSNIYRNNNNDKMMPGESKYKDECEKPKKFKPPLLHVQRPSNDNLLSQPLNYESDEELEERCREERSVSANIEVPQKMRHDRRLSDEPAMSDLMAALVLNKMSLSPVQHRRSFTSSPRSFESSGVDSWGSRQPSPTRHPTRSICPSFQREVDDVTNSESCVKRRARTLDDISYFDPGTILLRPPTPSKEEEQAKADDEDADEPRDFSMKTMRAKEAEEIRKREEKERKKEELKEMHFHSSPGITIPPPPPCNVVVPPNFSVPHYLSPFLPPTLPLSYSNELFLKLATSPLSSQLPPEYMIKSSPNRQGDGKNNRYSRRASPYHKVNDDSAYSSPLRGTSPSRFGYETNPDPYRLSSSGSSPSLQRPRSGSRSRKETRSPSLSKCSPYSSPSHSNHGINYLSSEGNSYQPPLTQMDYAPPLLVNWNEQSNYLHPASSFQQQGHHTKNNFLSPSKSLPVGIARKVPGDGKKCRKVYGMENKAMWCNACRWKKACQRFPD